MTRPFISGAFSISARGSYDQALADFNQVLKINPKHAEAYNNRGSIFTAKGQYDQAIADFNQALKLNPRYANAYYNRGVAYYNKSLYDKAIGDFNKCLELDPKLADAYFSKALALEAAGRQARGPGGLHRLSPVCSPGSQRPDRAGQTVVAKITGIVLWCTHAGEIFHRIDHSSDYRVGLCRDLCRRGPGDPRILETS